MDIHKPVDQLASGVQDTTKSFASGVQDTTKSFTSGAKPLYAEKIAEPLSKFRDDPSLNPVDKAQRATEATKNVMSKAFDPSRGPHSAQAQKLVLAKGLFDVFLSLSLIFAPGLFWDGILTKAISYATGLVSASCSMEDGEKLMKNVVDSDELGDGLECGIRAVGFDHGMWICWDLCGRVDV